MGHTQVYTPSSETVLEEAQMMSSLEKDFKWAIINTFTKVKEITSNKLKEGIRMMHH